MFLQAKAGWLVGVLSAVLLSASVFAQGEEPVLSEQGLYKVSFQSDPTPVPTNEMHQWILHVETAAGEPLSGAKISIDGGMPMHKHGLPTAPQVTADLGGGDYHVEGLKFHMPGQWVVHIGIDAAPGEDVATFKLSL